jgi:hypothetical protein
MMNNGDRCGERFRSCLGCHRREFGLGPCGLSTGAVFREDLASALALSALVLLRIVWRRNRDGRRRSFRRLRSLAIAPAPMSPALVAVAGMRSAPVAVCWRRTVGSGITGTTVRRRFRLDAGVAVCHAISFRAAHTRWMLQAPYLFVGVNVTVPARFTKLGSRRNSRLRDRPVGLNPSRCSCIGPTLIPACNSAGRMGIDRREETAACVSS